MEKQNSSLEARVERSEKRNDSLVARIEELESTQATTAHVNTLLLKEVDRLSQYQRRSNLVFRKVFVPEKEQAEQVEEKVRGYLRDMDLPNCVEKVDKAHRLGKVTTNAGGKKHQDIIVRFTSHSARYAVFNKRKSLRNVRISPNLTKTRGNLLADAISLTQNIERENWGFVFANSHGDLLVRLQEKHDGKNNHPFESLEDLESKLTAFGLLS